MQHTPRTGGGAASVDSSARPISLPPRPSDPDPEEEQIQQHHQIHSPLRSLLVRYYTSVHLLYLISLSTSSVIFLSLIMASSSASFENYHVLAVAPFLAAPALTAWMYGIMLGNNLQKLQPDHQQQQPPADDSATIDETLRDIERHKWAVFGSLFPAIASLLLLLLTTAADLQSPTAIMTATACESFPVVLVALVAYIARLIPSYIAYTPGAPLWNLHEHAEAALGPNAAPDWSHLKPLKKTE